MGPTSFRIVMNILAFGIGNLGGPDLLIILLIVFVLFGAKKLPDLARSLVQSMNKFRKERQDLDDQLHSTGTQPIHLPPCQQVASEPGAGQLNSLPHDRESS